jgi:hypothetical protein
VCDDTLLVQDVQSPRDKINTYTMSATHLGLKSSGRSSYQRHCTHIHIFTLMTFDEFLYKIPGAREDFNSNSCCHIALQRWE